MPFPLNRSSTSLALDGVRSNKKASWKKTFTHLHTQARPALAPFTVVLTSVILAVVLEQTHVIKFHEIHGLKTALSSFTFLLSMLMSFRVQKAYSFWYEGRMVWGQLISESSNFIQMVHSCVPPGELRNVMTFLVRAYPILLKNNLRGSSKERDKEELQQCFPDHPWNSVLLTQKNVVPGLRHRWVTLLLRKMVAKALSGGQIQQCMLLPFEESIQTMVMVAGVCSRIKSTPLLFGIASYFRFILLLFCTGLPWVMFALKAEWPVVVAGTTFVTYAFLSLDEIAVDCEEPFGLDDTDLPLANFVNIIQSSANVVVETEDFVDQIVSRVTATAQEKIHLGANSSLHEKNIRVRAPVFQELGHSDCVTQSVMVHIN